MGSLRRLPSSVLSLTPLAVPLDAAILAVRLSDGGAGTLAGATDVTKIPAAIDPALRRLGICPDGPPSSVDGRNGYQEAIYMLTEAADLVLAAPPFQDTSKTCDAVSVGIGFTMKPTRAPTRVVDPPPPPPDPCTKP